MNSTSSSPAFIAARSVNESRDCDARGCNLPRQGLDRWCAHHLVRGKRYGNPDARPVRPREWTGERLAVRALLAENADHAGVQQALEWVTTWLAHAARNERSFRGAEELARLVRHGVTAEAVLAEVCAAMAWLQSHPYALPDQRSEDFAISRAVLALAPRPRRGVRSSVAPAAWPPEGAQRTAQSYSPKARSSALASVGPVLRKTLGPFFANVIHSLETREEHQAAQQAAMRAPLRPALSL